MSYIGRLHILRNGYAITWYDAFMTSRQQTFATRTEALEFAAIRDIELLN
jgi:hypothetical protein